MLVPLLVLSVPVRSVLVIRLRKRLARRNKSIL
jgi:hypothetical protein